jgi:hypothetical protein
MPMKEGASTSGPVRGVRRDGGRYLSRPNRPTAAYRMDLWYRFSDPSFLVDVGDDGPLIRLALMETDDDLLAAGETL